jgi:hypothetical protein
MRRMARLITLVLGSICYWLAAVGLILILTFAVPGDCGTEQTAAGQRKCLDEVRMVALVGLAIAALAYGLLCYRVARRTWRKSGCDS